jgi:hypothetical protein
MNPILAICLICLIFFSHFNLGFFVSGCGEADGFAQD